MDNKKEQEYISLDGFSNVATSLGIKGKDKRLSGQAIFSGIVDDSTCLALYKDSGIGSLIAQKTPSIMTMKDVTIPGDMDGELLNKLKTLGYRSHIKLALADANAFGGSCILIGALDIATRTGKLYKPLVQEKVSDVKWLKNFDRTEIYYNQMEIVTDMTSPFFGSPEFFYINSRDGIFVNRRVHITRLMLFKGDNSSAYFGNPYDFWGFSIYQKCYAEIRKVETAFDNMEVIIDEFSTWKYQIDNLVDLMSAGKEDIVKKRIETINYSKSVINAIIHGKEETVSSETKSVGGLNQLVELMMQLLSSVTNIPESLLWGKGASGLNSTGEGDMINFYDHVTSLQGETLEHPINYLLSILNESMKIVDKPQVKFAPLKQMTEKELAEIRKLNADSDSIYIDTNVLTPEEIANARFAGENYSNDIKIEEREIDLSSLEEPEEEENNNGTEES
jgi:phage-related protein (TIGR01555 family)